MQNTQTFTVSSGTDAPLGASIHTRGINFAIYVEGDRPLQLILMDPQTKIPFATFDVHDRTENIRHIFIEGLTPPFAYKYHMDDLDLMDPYAKSLDSSIQWNDRSYPYFPNGYVLDHQFDWKEDRKLFYPREDLIIYEMHVRGFTRHESSSIPHPGTFLGVIEKIPYLKDLGVNAVELLPIYEFNETEYVPQNPDFAGKLFQYWGYSTVNFFSPMNRFASENSPGSALNDFKLMVRELHKAGIEVILDVVYNHTFEGNELGFKFGYKTFASKAYYHFSADDKYCNFSGCGNTFNCNHPVVTKLIIDSLKYWVTETHVDGFRFDLASTFYRGLDGNYISKPPVLTAMTKEPVLAGVKLIAEPWDPAGIYQVGSFFPESVRWSEWNGKYRDCMRKFIKGDRGIKGEFAGRLSGSEDLYGHDHRLPRNSVNYITCHDGFSLKDLVSYNSKHNEANGENNQDGMNENNSWNCGFEGPTEDFAVLAFRERQIRNYHLALMVSQGIPMVLMGDEYGHTRHGNNNTWCQDNELNWFLWDELGKKQAFYRFFKGLIHFRKANPILRHRKFLRDDDIEWHGLKPLEPIWEAEDQFVAFTLKDKHRGEDIYIAFNACETDAIVNFPPRNDGKIWRWIVNTSFPPPYDFREETTGMRVAALQYTMLPYSSLMLKAL